jgi:hypothetical protein
MKHEFHRRQRPGLLVSVRNAAEALAALAGGADVIDVKEPDRGPLGAADASTLAAVVRAVAGRLPVTAALGELIELIRIKRQPICHGVSFFKIGLAGCRSLPNWRSHWRDAIAAVGPSCREGPRAASPAAPAAVAYADWRVADAPEPEDVMQAALELGCPALLVDTWSKSTGSLFAHWPLEEVGKFVQSARSRGLHVVLAGSLETESLLAAAGLAPDLVAVRRAACDGGRQGTVSSHRVRALWQALDALSAPKHLNQRLAAIPTGRR